MTILETISSDIGARVALVLNANYDESLEGKQHDLLCRYTRDSATESLANGDAELVDGLREEEKDQAARDLAAEIIEKFGDILFDQGGYSVRLIAHDPQLEDDGSLKGVRFKVITFTEEEKARRLTVEDTFEIISKRVAAKLGANHVVDAPAEALRYLGKPFTFSSEEKAKREITLLSYRRLRDLALDEYALLLAKEIVKLYGDDLPPPGLKCDLKVVATGIFVDGTTFDPWCEVKVYIGRTYGFLDLAGS